MLGAHSDEILQIVKWPMRIPVTFNYSIVVNLTYRWWHTRVKRDPARSRYPVAVCDLSPQLMGAFATQASKHLQHRIRLHSAPVAVRQPIMKVRSGLRA